MSEILISIKPKYLDLILSGRKTVELRKQSTRIPPGTRLLLYASSPRRAVIGEARVAFREDLSLDEIWAKHGVAAAVSKDELRAYYSGADRGVVLGLTDVRRYPMNLPLRSLRDVHHGFRPPQSYMRAPAFIDALLKSILGEPPDDARGHEPRRVPPFIVPAE
jgi:predicted transcriptional regulator